MSIVVCRVTTRLDSEWGTERAARYQTANHGKLFWCILLGLGVSGCPQTTVEPVAVVRTVRTLVVAAGESTSTRVFPEKVDAAKPVELAFQLPRLLAKLSAREGQMVAKGDVTAGLLLAGQPLGLKALLGLGGEQIKYSIVVLDKFTTEIAVGKASYQAILYGCVTKLRPVLMVAITTVPGLIPLLQDPFFANNDIRSGFVCDFLQHRAKNKGRFEPTSPLGEVGLPGPGEGRFWVTAPSPAA